MIFKGFYAFSCDSAFKEDNARFTKGPLNASSDKAESGIWGPMFIIFKSDYFQLWFLYENDLRICTAGKCMRYTQGNCSQIVAI